jgi:hypothetical protein
MSWHALCSQPLDSFIQCVRNIFELKHLFPEKAFVHPLRDLRSVRIRHSPEEVKEH